MSIPRPPLVPPPHKKAQGRTNTRRSIFWRFGRWFSVVADARFCLENSRPLAHRRSLRRLFLTLLLLPIGLALLTIFLWSAWLCPLFAARVAARLGRPVEIGWLRPKASGFIAGDVVIYGMAPFEAEPLAYIERLEIDTGGDGGWLHPVRVLADGVDLRILHAPGADNLRGTARTNHAPDSDRARAQPEPAAARGIAPDHLAHLPAVTVRSGRLSGTLALPTGQRIALRAAAFSAEIVPESASLSLSNLSVELYGVATVHVPSVTIESLQALPDSKAGRTTLFAGQAATLRLPGGPPLFAGLALNAEYSADGASLTLSTPRTTGAAPEVMVAVRMSNAGLELDARATRLSLAGAAPLFEPRGLGVRDAAVDVWLTASLPPEKHAVAFTLDVGTTGIDLRHPAIDPTGWQDVPFSGHLRGHVELDSQVLFIEEGNGRLLSIPFLVQGQVDLAAAPRGQLVLTSPREGVECRNLLAAQPSPVRRALAGMQMQGRLEFRVALGFDATDWEELGLDIRLPRLCTVTAEPDVIARNRELLVSGGPGRLDHRPELAVGRDHPDFVPIGRVPAHVTSAFLSAEDNDFYLHHGFQLEMIRRALAHNLELGRLQRGASTITQQLAKNLFLTHDRTISRKLAETVLTWRLDRLLPKRRQLELYLNVIELGPDIRGIARAAERYFGKSVGALEALEGAHLASLPPNPRGYARRFRAGRVDDGWLHRLYDLLATMQRRGLLSGAEVAAARSSRLLLQKI